MGLSASEASEAAHDMVQSAHERAAQRANDVFEEGGGDTMLDSGPTNPQLSNYLASLRAEGVTDADFRWWWNMSAFEQEMLLKADELNRMSLFLFLTEDKGWSKEDAIAKVWKHHPNLGSPTGGTGADRLIPFELKRRIIEWMEGQTANPSLYQARMEAASSFNALIREEMQAGRL